jgi:hypothetical protein
MEEARLAGFGKPRGNRKELNGPEMVPECVSFYTYKAYHILILIQFFDLMLLAPWIYENPSKELGLPRILISPFGVKLEMTALPRPLVKGF